MPLDLSAVDDWVYRHNAQDWAAASTKEPLIGKAPYVVMGGGQLADLLTTVYALKQPGLKEGNPLLGQSPAKIAAAKAAATAALATVMHVADRKGHDRLAKAIGYSTGALGAAIAAHNVRQIQKAKARQ